MTSIRARRALAIFMLLGMSLVSLSPATFAIQSATVGVFSDSSCATQVTSTNLGSTIYVELISYSGHPDRSPFSMNIVDKIGATVHSVSGIASQPYCDTTGYLIPTGETTGTWTITVLDTNNVNICTSGCSFTVNGAVPDVPYGALFLVIPFIVVYLMIRRRTDDE